MDSANDSISMHTASSSSKKRNFRMLIEDVRKTFAEEQRQKKLIEEILPQQ